jgi:beta-lactamase class A
MHRIFTVMLLGLVALAPLVSAEPLADRIAGLTQGFKGTVVLYAKHLSTGREFGVAPDTRVRTASTIKLPILCALESLVDAGKVKWDERIILKPEDKVSGSGILASLEDRTELTVRNVAILMIVLSDNTATNLILDRIGADAVNGLLGHDRPGEDARQSQGARRRRQAGRPVRLEQGRRDRGQQALRPWRLDTA